MRSLKPNFTFIPGNILRQVAVDRVNAGDWNIDAILGVQGAITTATMLVRRTSDDAVLLTYASTILGVPQNPFRVPAQRLTVGVDTDVEFVVQNSSPSSGAAFVDDIRISRAPLQMWTNNIRVLLGAELPSPQLYIDLQPGAGDLIGLSPTNGQFFMATIRSNDGIINEIVRCTARLGDRLTVQRGQENTSARTWSVVGNTVTITATAGTLAALQSGL